MKNHIRDLSYLATMEIVKAQAQYQVSKRHGKFKYETDRKFKNKRDRKEAKDFY